MYEEIDYAIGHLKSTAIIEALHPREDERDGVMWAYRFVCETDQFVGDNNVYFIEAASANLIKIGRSINPERRLQQLQLLSPVRLSIIGIVRGGSSVETLLHDRFQSLLSHGEWFFATPRLRDFIKVASIMDRRHG